MSDPITDQLFDMQDEKVEEGTPFEEEAPPEQPFHRETIPPVYTRQRSSGENLLAYAAVGMGTLLVNKRIDPPVGRCLQLEAPLIGQKLDAVIAGTFLDKILQPLFSSGDKLEELGAVLALPLLVAVMERKPEMAPVLMEPLSASLGSVLEQAAPLMRKRKTAQRRFARSLSDIHEAFDIPRGADPIEAILTGFIFQDMQIKQEENVAEPAPA